VRFLRPERLPPSSSPQENGPALIAVLPMQPETMVGVVREGHGVFVAAEIANGDPRAIAEVRREHDQLVDVERNLHLAMISGSNLHGWGRTASAWTLLRIPGWQHLSPSALGAAIEASL